ncbi:MAG: RDD family protein [Syntrophus sp. PtaU1.Bin208]|nr:MAG: RDD family protein [Syntrophus sp. PtaU1.Bin208]
MTSYRYGGFWKRSIAYLVDKVILFFICLLFLVVGLSALNSGFNGLEPGKVIGRFSLIYYVMTHLLGMLYFTYFHGTVGQTPGKMLLGLQVIQSSGEKMTLGLAFLRWVGSIFSGLILYLGFLWIIFDRKKQGWHDKIAETLVICRYEEPPFSEEEQKMP